MITVNISDVKTNLSKILTLVQDGNEINVIIDNKPTIRITKITNEPVHKRKIGLYDGITSFSETDDGKITEEEFLGMS